MGRFLLGYTNYTTSTGNKTTAKIIGKAGARFEVVEAAMTGAGAAAAADVMHECKVAFLTNGTSGVAGSIPLPEKMDQGSAASTFSVGTGFTTEPTAYNTNVFTLFGFNQRGGMRWAVPEGAGFKSDGGQTALSFGQLVISSAAGNISGNVIFVEP